MSDCICVKEVVAADGTSLDRFICDRTDEHLSDFGSDSEGHHWVEATKQQWARRAAIVRQVWGQHGPP